MLPGEDLVLNLLSLTVQVGNGHRLRALGLGRGERVLEVVEHARLQGVRYEPDRAFALLVVVLVSDRGDAGI